MKSRKWHFLVMVIICHFQTDTARRGKESREREKVELWHTREQTEDSMVRGKSLTSLLHYLIETSHQL